MKQCILVVDDNRSLLAGIRTILEAEGYTVFTAVDGAEALRMIAEKVRPDLIILDVTMPQVDGYALFESIQACPGRSSIPFLFLTTERNENFREARDLGVDDCISKSFTSQDLVAAVRLWLQQVPTSGSDVEQSSSNLTVNRSPSPLPEVIL